MIKTNEQILREKWPERAEKAERAKEWNCRALTWRRVDRGANVKALAISTPVKHFIVFKVS